MTIAPSFTASIPYVLSFAAVVGTFFGIIYTNKVNARLQNDRMNAEAASKNRDMLRSKGEDIFLLLREFQDSFHTNINDVTMAVISRTKRPVDVIDLRVSTTSLLKLSMLTRVYFPEAIPELEKLEAHRSKLEAIGVDLVHNNFQQSEITAGKLLEATEYVRLNTALLQDKIVRALQNLHADITRPGI